MKINVNQIPFDGLSAEEIISPQSWDLETDEVKFIGNLKLMAVICRITNVVTVDLDLSALVKMHCSRCLAEVDVDLNKKLKLNYQVPSSQQMIDIDQDVREEIILDYPVKVLCKPDCKGLCLKCGKPLNKGGCSCGST